MVIKIILQKHNKETHEICKRIIETNDVEYTYKMTAKRDEEPELKINDLKYWDTHYVIKQNESTGSWIVMNSESISQFSQIIIDDTIFKT